MRLDQMLPAIAPIAPPTTAPVPALPPVAGRSPRLPQRRRRRRWRCPLALAHVLAAGQQHEPRGGEPARGVVSRETWSFMGFSFSGRCAGDRRRCRVIGVRRSPRLSDAHCRRVGTGLPRQSGASADRSTCSAVELHRRQPRVQPAARAQLGVRARSRRSAPASITTMRSARCTVARRCAMTSVVRSCIAASSAACTMRSLSASSALVASSSSSSGGFFSIARAIAMRWRWPPDRRTPRSPRKVR